jgi:hypothetical protein
MRRDYHLELGLVRTEFSCRRAARSRSTARRPPPRLAINCARELENALERAVAPARSDRIGADDLPSEVGAAPPAVGTDGNVSPLDEVERDYIGRLKCVNKPTETIRIWLCRAVPKELVKRRSEFELLLIRYT